MASIFGYTDDYVADYPVHNPEFREQIGELIARVGKGSKVDERKI